ncbi:MULTISPECIES: glutaredoxin family protein [unclassified Thermosynechococcus]|uniref:glutaredoxin family protein n=1 Tax=unclassified Thermosynechococcus TaxID=2622553 RepID=UPI00267115E7|nr:MULTISPECIES: glutaredoxin family protein [unclassified Thermosynechococcus]WKT84418.1 glutaredoxin family protein [Thermosynechococcus sp. HY596]WNC63551.1 glutaredoxin family protein [Thermosynechococcus sp. HY591]WNC66111.1 glutaredoxin family protein [Thermosynechococcus sp. HY593]
MTHLILYSKPGCHLCEGLQEKLATLREFTLEVRDITSRDDWWQAYQYEIPVLYLVIGTQVLPVPRFSPRASAEHIRRRLQQLTHSGGASSSN